jgi:hypothetical protein
LQHSEYNSQILTFFTQVSTFLTSRAADDDNYFIMASLDLSAAFDLVDIELSMKRIRIMGLPVDLINLFKTWLTERKFYVEINEINTGTIQGFVLWPLLDAIFNQKDLKISFNLYFYSVLYYNSEIWMSPNLNCNSKHMILAASANAIPICLTYCCINI